MDATSESRSSTIARFASWWASSRAQPRPRGRSIFFSRPSPWRARQAGRRRRAGRARCAGAPRSPRRRYGPDFAEVLDAGFELAGTCAEQELHECTAPHRHAADHPRRRHEQHEPEHAPARLLPRAPPFAGALISVQLYAGKNAGPNGTVQTTTVTVNVAMPQPSMNSSYSLSFQMAGSRNVTDYRQLLAEILEKRCGTSGISTIFPGAPSDRLGVVKVKT